MKRDINTLSLLNEISELVYVSDPETYELLFVNQTGCQTLHLENYKHKKCYEVLQGKTSPCEFCTNDRLCDDNFYTWEFTNPSIGRHFLLKDKIIQWRGKTARMEIAFDITELELQKQELKNMLDVQTLITNCVRMLYAVDNLDQTINAVLTQIGEFLVSDRAYVFEIKDELMNNTHEWTAPGISPQLEKLGTLVVMGWYYIIGLAITAPFFWKYIDHVPFLRLPLFAQAELGYILILGTVLPMYLLYRGTEKLTSVHTALYRYIQPVIAGILAITRGQAHFDAANITASVFIFAGVILVVVGYKYYVRHGLPKLRSDGRLEH